MNSANIFKEEVKRKVDESSSKDLSYLLDFKYQVGLDVGDDMIEVNGLEKFILKGEAVYEVVDINFIPEKGVLILIDFWVS